ARLVVRGPAGRQHQPGFRDGGLRAVRRLRRRRHRRGEPVQCGRVPDARRRQLRGHQRRHRGRRRARPPPRAARVNTTSLATLLAVLAVVVGVSVVMRPRGSSTLDFYLAGQKVGIVTNAWAICGDYLSAASFLGVAAAVYVSGLDGAWYAVGFAAGFVPVLLFVAAPLRRYGEFSIPDFLGRRLGSERVRLVAVAVVQLVILSYLIPQSVGGGITWQLLVGEGFFGLSPYATGVLLSTAVVAAIVAFGGMRGTTWNQAVQFLLLLVALVWLAAVVIGEGFRYGDAVDALSAEPLANPSRDADGWVLQEEVNRIDGAQ